MAFVGGKWWSSTSLPPERSETKNITYVCNLFFRVPLLVTAIIGARRFNRIPRFFAGSARTRTLN